MGGGAANRAFTESLLSTMMVNTPRAVPKGMKAHATHATAKQNP